jgi:hypothetical protein
MTNTITLHAGGTGEREIEVSAIEVPDLWHVAMHLQGKAETEGNPQMKLYADMVLDCWHLAHDMKNHLQANPPAGLNDAAYNAARAKEEARK